MGPISKCHQEKRRRSSRVCQECQRRRVRCDFAVGGSPCTNCSHFKVQCLASSNGRRSRYDSPREEFETLLQSCYGLKKSSIFPHASPLQYETVEPDGVETIEHRTGQTFIPQDCNFSSPVMMNEGDFFNYLIEEPAPRFIAQISPHVDSQDMNHLRAKGSFLIPREPLRTELLRAFIQRVYHVFPILNISGMISAISSNDGCPPVSLLLFQAVMLSALPYIDLDKLRAEGFQSKNQAQSVFSQKVLALYYVGHESSQLVMIQASFLLSLTDNPTAMKDSWYWLGISLSLAQAVEFHLDAPGCCDGNKRLARRIWWSIFIQDKRLGLAMKYPCRIGDDDHTVPMLSLDDFDIKCEAPAISEFIGQDIGLQDTDYQEMLALCSIRTAALCIVVGEVLRTQYTLSSPIVFDGETPSTAIAPSRKATRDDIQLHEHKLALCMTDTDFKWSAINANQRLTDSKDETLALLYAEISLTHLTALMALYRPLIWPVRKSPRMDDNLQIYSRLQVKLVASKISEVCEMAQEKGVFSRLSHITATCVFQAAIIQLSFAKSSDEVEQMLRFSQFDRLFRFLKDMDDSHATAKLGVSLLYSILQKAGCLQTK